MNVRRIAGATLVGLALAGCSKPATVSLGQSAIVPVVARSQSAFTDLQGRPVALAQFQGHPIVLSFLDPQQADSQAQLPQLIRLAGAYQAEGVVFVIGGEAPYLSDLTAFAASNGLTFPVWHDRGGSELKRRGFSQLPAHEFIRRDGSIASRHEGFMSRGELLDAISQLQP